MYIGVLLVCVDVCVCVVLGVGCVSVGMVCGWWCGVRLFGGVVGVVWCMGKGT